MENGEREATGKREKKEKTERKKGGVSVGGCG